MKNNRNSIDIASTTLILSLILFSYMASAAPVQSASPLAPYAYITNSGSGTISVFDTANNTVIATVNVGMSPGKAAVTPDGSKVYVENYGLGSVSVINMANNTVIATVPVGEFPDGIAVTPDGTKLYVATVHKENQFYKGYISAIDTATNKVIAAVNVGYQPNGIAVSPDGTKVYVTGLTFTVIDTATNNITATVNVESPSGVAVSPDGTKVYVTSRHGNSVFVIDTATNNVTASIPVGAFPTAVAVSPEGKKVYVTYLDGYSVTVIDTTTNTVTATVYFGKHAQGMAVNPSGTKLFVTNPDGDMISIIDTASNTVTTTVTVGNQPYDIQFAPYSAQKSLLRVNFSSNITYGYAPLIVRFSDLSQNATGWNWDFGDGTNSTLQNPEHTYSTPGYYTVKLLANNENYIDSKFARIAVLDYNIPIVANFTANPTSGYVPTLVQFTDLSQNAAGWNWDFGDGVSSTFQNPEHLYGSSGDYIVNLTLSNENVTAFKTATIHVEDYHIDPYFLHDSGSGTSGGGGSPEPVTNVEAKELSNAIVTSGNSAKFDFPKNATSIVFVSFYSKRTTGKTTTTVEMLKNKSAITSSTPTGEIYKYLNIWVGSSGFGTSNNIENSVVYFKVEKSWIQDKNIDQSSITLNMYNDKKWDKLSTNLTGEDEKYQYFTAQTPGFSSFAITGKIKATETETQLSLRIKHGPL
jgi:PGF-pre-PGF domain-containing protein